MTVLRSRLPKFSLRTLMLFVALFAGGMGIYCFLTRQTPVEKAVWRIQDLYGSVRFQNNGDVEVSYPGFVSRTMGGDCVASTDRLDALFELQAVASPIRKLSFWQASDIDDTALKRIAKLGELNHLELVDTSIQGEGLRYLGELRELQHLRLSGINGKLVTLRHLGSLESLEHLVLAGEELQDSDLQAIQELPRLRELRLCGSPGISDAGMKFIADAPTIEYLSISHNSVTDIGVTYLCSLPHLRKLDLSFTLVTDSVFEHLSKCSSLEEISVLGSHVSQEALNRFLQSNPSIRLFSL